MEIMGFELEDVAGGAALALFLLFSKWATAKAIRTWFGSKESG